MRVVVVLIVAWLAGTADAATARHWRLETKRGPVHVWAPAQYDPTTAATLVYLHGYHMNVDEAWAQHALEEQFLRAGVNALVIAPASPKDWTDGVVWHSLESLLETVTAGIKQPLPKGKTIAVAYSGGFRTVDFWLGTETLDTIVLLDGLYGETQPYVKWLARRPHHRFIYVGAGYYHAKFERGFRPEFTIPDVDQIVHLYQTATTARSVDVKTPSMNHLELIESGLLMPAIVGLVAPNL